MTWVPAFAGMTGGEVVPRERAGAFPLPALRGEGQGEGRLLALRVVEQMSRRLRLLRRERARGAQRDLSRTPPEGHPPDRPFFLGASNRRLQLLHNLDVIPAPDQCPG